MEIFITKEELNIIEKLLKIENVISSMMVDKTSLFQGLLFEGEVRRFAEIRDVVISKALGLSLSKEEASLLYIETWKKSRKIFEEHGVVFTRRGLFKGDEEIFFKEELPLLKVEKRIKIERRYVRISLVQARQTIEIGKRTFSPLTMVVDFDLQTQDDYEMVNWKQPVKAFFKIIREIEVLWKEAVEKGAEYMAIKGYDEARYSAYKAYLIKRGIDFTFIDSEWSILVKKQ